MKDAILVGNYHSHTSHPCCNAEVFSIPDLNAAYAEQLKPYPEYISTPSGQIRVFYPPAEYTGARTFEESERSGQFYGRWK